MENLDYRELQKWLDELKEIPIRPARVRTLMDITGIKHHENLWSDIYQFFFTIGEEHHFGDVFIRSLESQIGLKTCFLESFSVTREFVVNEKRIDLLLCDNRNNRAIIIENKVNHLLNNDLNLYYKEVCNKGYSNVIVVVLGIKKYNLKHYDKANEIPESKLFSVTHKELIDEVGNKITGYFKQAKPQYLYLLQEFSKNIINKTNEMNTDELRFYFEENNRLKINQLSDVRNDVINYISGALEKEEVLKPLFRKYNLNLNVDKCKDNRYIYYPYKGYEGKAMITLVYHSLWDFKSNGCRIQVILEFKGDEMINWVMKHNSDKSMNGLNKNLKYWHYYSCEIPFNPKELESNFQECLCKKLSDDSLCPTYKIGIEILERYEKDMQ